MDGTIIQQGNFTSTGVAKFIPLRSGADWFKTWNYSTIGSTANPGVGYMFEWQRGMLPGYSFAYTNTAGTDALNLEIFTADGFTWVDSTVTTLGPLSGPLTAISNAATPVAAQVGHGLLTGDIVRLYNTTGAEQLGGYDIMVTYNDANHFDLTNIPQLAVAATSGYWRKITYTPEFYPTTVTITRVTQAVNPLVTYSIPHGYTVGQQIRFNVTSGFGMIELDGRTANILSVPSSTTLTVDVDTTGFTPFVFPAVAWYPFTPSSTTPVGEGLYSASPIVPPIYGSTALPHDLLDATYNNAEMGMLLGAGAFGPAGINANVIYWQAGKSFNM